MKQEKGVITVFLALIFSVIFVFLCSMIEVTRVNSAKNQLIIASDAAITSALSQFDKELYEEYGVLAYEYSDEIKETVKEIMSENLTDSGLFNISVDDAVTMSLIGNYSIDDCVKFKEILESNLN